MTKCKDCEFWKRLTDETEIRLEEKFAGACSCDKFVYTGDGVKIKSDEFGYLDYDSYDAKFFTGENFGCVHGKNK